MSNDVIFQFIVPGLFACVMSAILQAVGNSEIASISYSQNKKVSRSVNDQGAWQLMAIPFCFGCALIAGGIIGFIMKLAHRPNQEEYFNDEKILTYPEHQEKY